jgi:hypothetical protein
VNVVCASVVVPEPRGIVVVTRRLAASITDTVLSLALVTYALVPPGPKATCHGVRPTGIRPTVCRRDVSTTSTASLSVSVM